MLKNKWKIVTDDLEAHQIKITNFVESPQEMFYFEDAYLVFWNRKRPLFVTSDFHLIDISNHDYSVSRNVYLPSFDYTTPRKRVQEMISLIKKKEYETIEKTSISFLAHQPFMSLHNVEDKINIMENSIKNKIFEKNDRFSLLVMKTENIFYNNCLSEITNVYKDYNFEFEYLDVDKVYKISKLYVSKIYIDYIAGNISEKNFIKYLNRKKKYNATLANSLLSETFEKSICVKIMNGNNGTNAAHRVINFDLTYKPEHQSVYHNITIPNNENTTVAENCDAVTFFKKYGFLYLNDISPLEKDYIIMNSELSIVSWGSNMYINMKMLNYFSGNKFIVLTTSGYNWEMDIHIPVKDRVSKPLYTMSDRVVDGNFVRFISNFSDHITQNKFDRILRDFKDDFAFEEIYQMLKSLKDRYKYDFLDDLPEYVEYVKDFRVNIFWNKIGYSLIEIFYKCEYINLKEFFNNLFIKHNTLSFDKIISDKLHVIELVEFIKSCNPDWRSIFVPNNFWELYKKNKLNQVDREKIDVVKYITTGSIV
jgi:hypothetical protein